MSMRSDRSGFALPMAILLIGFLTAGVVAAFARTTAEIRVVDNQRALTSAYAVAQAGLERYIARGRISPLDTTIIIGRDTARVRAILMRPAVVSTDTAVWLIRSIGTTVGGAGIPPGRRTVAQFAYRLRGRMHVLASWTTLSGLKKQGTSGIITGDDYCTTDSVAGVALPDGTYTQSGVPPGGQVVYGDPPIKEMGTQTEMADSIKIDWANISNPTAPALTADYIVCYPGTYGYDSRWSPCTGWPPVSVFSDPNYWPTIIVNGSENNGLPSISGGGPNARGTLIVTGNLVFGGGDKFDGIIMSGGWIDDNGSGHIAGAVLSGLNVLKGEMIAQSSKADGTKDYQFDSCKVENAANAQMKLMQISNAWVDNWTAW